MRNLYESNDLPDPLSSGSFRTGSSIRAARKRWRPDGKTLSSETIRDWQLYIGCRRQSRQNRVELKGVTWSVVVFRCDIIVTTVRARAPGGRLLRLLAAAYLGQWRRLAAAAVTYHCQC